MKTLYRFHWNNAQIRCLMDESELWFLGVDVVHAMGISNVSKALSHIDRHSIRTFEAYGKQLQFIDQDGAWSIAIEHNKDEDELRMHFIDFVDLAVTPIMGELHPYKRKW